MRWIMVFNLTSTICGSYICPLTLVVTLVALEHAFRRIDARHESDKQNEPKLLIVGANQHTACDNNNVLVALEHAFRHAEQ